MDKKEHEDAAPVALPQDVTAMTAASERWMQELGVVVENLAYMLRKPTEHRPFVYELRIDLLPATGNHGKMVLKGFGQDQGLVAFVDGDSFLASLRNCQASMSAGKLKWYPDSYVPGNYAERLARFLSGEFYRV